MHSRLNEMENEGLVVIGRGVATEWDTPEPIHEVVATIEAWAQKLSLPLGLIYCGTTINWPDEVRYTPMVIGLITFSGYGDDDDPVAGVVEPSQMDITRGAAIPQAFWDDLKEKHGVELRGELDVYLAIAGWTWAKLERDGERVCSTSGEDSGFRSIPPEVRTASCVMKAGYC